MQVDSLPVELPGVSLIRVKEQSETAALKLTIQKTMIMASGSITSWQIEGEKVEIMTDFIFLDSKTPIECDCSHEIKRRLLFGRKAMTNLDSILKKQRHCFAKNVCIVKDRVLLVVIYGCEVWTTKKAECQSIDAFKLWC